MKFFLNSIIIGGLMLCSSVSFAQKGNSSIQVSAQFDVPTGELAKAAKIGYGFAVKGLLGFGQTTQQLTLEVGNNFFDLKDKYRIENVQVNLSSWPIYLGYRRYYNKFYTESQIGVAFNKRDIFRTDLTPASMQDGSTKLALAEGIGYKIADFEFEARYQYLPIKHSPDIGYFGFRAAYNLPFSRKEEEGKK